MRPDHSRPDLGIVRVDRRDFIKGTAAFALGLVLAGKATIAEAASYEVFGGDVAPHLFITLNEDNTVDLVCHRSEMGQQIWTSLAQILVEELDLDWKQVRIQQAEGDKKYGSQNTDGSRSIRNNFERFRVMGAAMRTMLETAAAQKWGVKPSTVVARRGEVVHAASKRRMTYGALAADAQKLPLPPAKDVKLKPRDQWRSIAKPVKSLTTPLIVKGEGTYGQDLRMDGMVVAVIAHPPQVFATVKSFDDSAARAVPGVVDVIEMPAPTPPAVFQPLGGIAVLATNTWAAMKGREALQIEWDAGPNAVYDSEEFAKTLMAETRKTGAVKRNRGDVYAALDAAKTQVEAEYYVPHLAHSSMEPPAALAHWNGDSVTVEGCTQTPQSARNNVAKFCGVDESKVTTQVSWLGGGFGRKSKPDFFAEAAWLARKANKPVKLVWTREDALQHSYYHTVSAQRLEAGLAEDGKCTAFLHRVAFPTIGSTFVEGKTDPSWGDLRLGASDTPFAVPNLRLEAGEAEAHIRIGWLRSVANIYHAFAVQSFAAEMAHAAGRDPKDYLLELIGPDRTIDPNDEGAQYDNYGSPLEMYPIDTARMKYVTKRAASLAGWGRELPEGHGLGIAVHRSFVSYVATVIEAAVDEEGRLTIPGVWSVIDAGTVVNPNHVAAQMEGGTLFGLSNALFGEITAKNGIVEQANFPGFRLMRMNEAPRDMVVEIVESTAPPGGVGEPPTPPAAPALTNAIFAACGVRVRTLPVFDRTRRDRLPVPGSTGGAQ